MDRTKFPPLSICSRSIWLLLRSKKWYFQLWKQFWKNGFSNVVHQEESSPIKVWISNQLHSRTFGFSGEALRSEQERSILLGTMPASESIKQSRNDFKKFSLHTHWINEKFFCIRSSSVPIRLFIQPNLHRFRSCPESTIECQVKSFANPQISKILQRLLPSDNQRFKHRNLLKNQWKSNRKDRTNSMI